MDSQSKKRLSDTEGNIYLLDEHGNKQVDHFLQHTFEFFYLHQLLTVEYTVYRAEPIFPD